MGNNFLTAIGRLRLIQRWGLKRNTIPENVMEHSWEVAVVGHLLGVIHNQVYGGKVCAERLATMALYHDCSEAITGDLPTPIKYYSKEIQHAYKLIETDAQQELVSMLPKNLRGPLGAALTGKGLSLLENKLLKAADTLSAYLKAKAELANGNSEYEKITRDLEKRLSTYELPEVNYFINEFVSDRPPLQKVGLYQVGN